MIQILAAFSRVTALITGCQRTGELGAGGRDSGDNAAPDGNMELPVILNAGPDGYVVAECPVIPGCISQGRTRREALRNIREAIELCLESQADEGWELASHYDVARVKFAGAVRIGRRVRPPRKVHRVAPGRTFQAPKT